MIGVNGRLAYRRYGSVSVTRTARATVRHWHHRLREAQSVARSQDLLAMPLQVIGQLYAERIPRVEALDLDEKVNRLAEALLKSQSVVLGRGRGRGRMGDAVDAVFGVRVHRCHSRVLRVLSKALQVFHMTYGHLDDLGFLDSAATLLQVFRGYQSAQIGKTIVHAISSALLDDPMRHRILLLV